MKKTLVAFAALAVVGAASAQSSVTLYGRIDASIGSEKASFNGATTANPGIQIRSGVHTGSRWGMKGSEDLGGGLKANFQLEQGFNVDDGTASAAARQFHRQAWVGLSGGFGSVTVGRQYDMTDNMYATYDAAGYSGYSAMGYAFNAGSSGDFIGRQDNAVIYSTPTMGGFGASAMWAPGENGVPGGASAGKAVGFLANYSNGPLGVGGSWQSNKATGATAATTNMGFGASYDIGVAKLFGQYEWSKVKSAPGTPKDNGWSLGAVVPVGAASLIASYASEKAKAAGAKVSDAKSFMLMGRYDMSKRTYVYAAYRTGEVDPVGAANTTKNRRMGLGLVHNF